MKLTLKNNGALASIFFHFSNAAYSYPNAATAYAQYGQAASVQSTPASSYGQQIDYSSGKFHMLIPFREFLLFDIFY